MPRTSTTWTTKFSDAEKAAAIRARVVDGLTASEVARRAAAGELEGVGRFLISRNYVNLLVRKANAEHNPETLADPNEAARASATAQSRLLAWILRAIDQWEANAKAGEFDWPEHDRIMRSLREHTRTTKPGPKTDTGQDNDPTNNGTTDTAAIIRQLLEQTQPRSNEATTPGSAVRAGSGDPEATPLTSS